MKTAPIVIFVYNRPKHLRQTIAALQKNYLAQTSEVIIFSDGPKEGEDPSVINEIREFICSIKGFRSIMLNYNINNIGLAESIIQGMDIIFRVYDSAIVLEDDLITSPDFLRYINDCLVVYKDDRRIFSISGYSPNIDLRDYDQDIYLTPRPCSWGWATWRDRWNKVDWEVKDFKQFIHNRRLRKEFNQGGKDSSMMLLKQICGGIDSWAIRFYYSCFKHGGYCVYPVTSKVKSTGVDGSGSHIGRTSKYDLPYELQSSPYVLTHAWVSEDVVKRFANFYRPSVLRRVINYLIFSNL